MKYKMLAMVVVICSLWTTAHAADDQWITEAYHRSLAHERLQKYSDAIKAMTPVLKAYPDGYTVNLRLGWLSYLAGHYANAIDHYRKAVQVAPNSIEARQGLLLPLLAQKKFVQAEQIATQILRTDLYNYYGNLRLIQALRGQKKYKTAHTTALRMLSVYPANVTFLQQLAELEVLLGNKQMGAATYRSVYILDPENLAARAYLGLDGGKKK